MSGIYCLVINVSSDVTVKIGAIGEIEFSQGTYIYIGSAQRAMDKRLARHARKEKRLRWHIDYLLANPQATLTDVYTLSGAKHLECETSQKLLKIGTSIAKFGSSDCKCVSHLIKVEKVSVVAELGFKRSF